VDSARSEVFSLAGSAARTALSEDVSEVVSELVSTSPAPSPEHPETVNAMAMNAPATVPRFVRL
jgi:hypothetical protein